MEKPTFPQRSCREAVWNGPMVYPCEVVALHPGPHANFSSLESVKHRDAWENNNPDWKDEVGSIDTMI